MKLTLSESTVNGLVGLGATKQQISLIESCEVRMIDAPAPKQPIELHLGRQSYHVHLLISPDGEMSPGTQTDRLLPCARQEHRNNWEAYGTYHDMAVTFECPKHGKITLDFSEIPCPDETVWPSRPTYGYPVRPAIPYPRSSAHVRIYEGITPKDLAEKLGIKTALPMKKLMDRGIFATVDQNLDIKLASDLAREFGGIVVPPR